MNFFFGVRTFQVPLHFINWGLQALERLNLVMELFIAEEENKLHPDRELIQTYNFFQEFEFVSRIQEQPYLSLMDRLGHHQTSLTTYRVG